jgi:hypothetical protein
MVFTSVEEIKKAIKKLNTTYGGKRTQYPILFKLAVCEFMERKVITPYALAGQVRMTAPLMVKWNKQYIDGLYSMEGAYNVSKKSLSTNQSILEILNTEVNLLQRKIVLIKEAETLGLTITQE